MRRLRVRARMLAAKGQRRSRPPAPARGPGRLLLVLVLALTLTVQPLPPVPAAPRLPTLSLSGPWRALGAALGAGESFLASGLRWLGGALGEPAKARAAPGSSGVTNTASASVSPSAPPPPAIGTVVTDAPQELTSLRTQTAKFFRMPDGSHLAKVYSGPIHYRDQDGTWQEIDTTLVPSTTPGFAWQNKAGSFSARFAATARAAGIEEVSDGAQVASFGLAGARASRPAWTAAPSPTLGSCPAWT